MDGESLFEVLERYKDMMRAFPHHVLDKFLIVHMFYNGLLYNTRMTVDAATGGALMNKSLNDAYALIEKMDMHSSKTCNPVEKMKPRGGMQEVSSFDHMNVKVNALT